MEIAPWHVEELDSSRARVAAISDVRRIKVYFIFMLALFVVLSDVTVELCDFSCCTDQDLLDAGGWCSMKWSLL